MITLFPTALHRFSLRAVGLASMALLLAGPVLAQDSAGAAAASQVGERRPVAELREDFAVLRAVLEEAHPGANRYVSEADLKVQFDTIADELDHPLSEVEFLALIQPAVAAIQDGHTRLTLSEAGEVALRREALVPPFTVHVADGRLFVRHDLATTAGADLSGREIKSINGRSAPDIIADMTRITSVDGAGISRTPYLLSEGLRFNRMHALLYGTTPTFEIVLQADGSLDRVYRNGATLAELDETWTARFPADRAPRPPVSVEFRDDGAVALLTIKSFPNFADEARTQRTDDLIDQAFEAIKAQGSRVIILDLRDNGGGSDVLGRILFAHIADRPFGYYRGLYVKALSFSFAEHSNPPGPFPEEMFVRAPGGRLAMAQNPNLGQHDPDPDHFAGRVIILMNGGSFSTTSEFLSVAHHNHRALFVGEEAGGGYYGNTSGPSLTVTLPNTGLVLHSPVLRYELAVDGFRPIERGVPPHYRVAPDIDDLLAGRDPAMAYALELARREPDRGALDEGLSQ